MIDDAWNAAERTRELDPSFIIGLWAVGYVQQLRGHEGDAIGLLSRAVDLSARSPMSLAELGCTLAVCGRRDESLATIQELESRGVDSHFAAHVRWALGDHAEAMSLFDRAVRERAAMIWMGHFPGQEGLWKDRRWHEILRSAGLTALIPADAVSGR
jgi:tetratricopeptide (TPR) repeat protein